MKKNAAFCGSHKVMYKYAMLTMTLLLFFLLSPASNLTAETITFTIVHSSNLKGHLFPCPT